MATGTVKFFNPSKGFGFIAPEDGSPDVFVHATALERAGISELNEGDRVTFEVQEDRRSGKIAATDLRVTGSGPAAARGGAPRSQGGFQRSASPPRGQSGRQAEGSGRGTVKWFNTTKGFGFIQPNDGGEDVFVHISAVERAGLRDLPEGTVVSYELQRDSRSGKVAAANLQLDD